MNMLLFPVPIFRRRRARPKNATAPAPPPPAPLVLVSAHYNESGGPEGQALLILQFDRPINMDAFDSGAFEVIDAEYNMQRYNAAGGWGMINPSTVEFTLLELEIISGSGIHLSVSPASGIVAVDDGGTWAGVTDLPLPFP